MNGYDGQNIDKQNEKAIKRMIVIQKELLGERVSEKKSVKKC